MKSRPIGVQSILATDHNTRRDDARGASFLLAHQQLGALALGTTPTNGQTVTFVVNGTSVLFTAVTGTPTNPGDVKAPGTALGFVTNLVAALRRPDLTTSTFIALSGPNQVLIQYIGWAWPGASTNIVPFSLNKNVNGATASLTSFNITTTVTSGTWTAQTMQIYVEDGTYYINGTRYLFTGGSTPTVTAPGANPRIDVLTIDTSGTLAWTTGAENASPVAPTYPVNKLAICELYNVVSETALYDNENQQTSQGYISNDVRPTATAGPNLGAIPDDLIPDAADTRNLGAASFEWNNIYGKNLYSNGVLVSSQKFGGTGSDGALSVSSGTTTINCAGAAIVIKNYTSIAITGTGLLAFSNPHANGTIVILKSQGAVTITSSATPCIDLTGMGASSASDGNSLMVSSYQGVTGTSGASAAGAIGGSANRTIPMTISGKVIKVYAGAGGGVGGTGASGSGAGGIGGGGLSIESAGALNFTGNIKSNGGNGVAGPNNAGSGGGGGGGGGGAAGSVSIAYGSVTANSGTFTLTGGTGGQGGSSNFNAVTTQGSGGGGGGTMHTGGTGGNSGASGTNANTNATGGGGGTAGSNGSSGSNGGNSCGGGGGGGAGGDSLVTQNTEFA